MDKFPECADCINKELDPFQCDSCEDGCNFEPYESDDDMEDSEEMTLEEFKEFWRNIA